jgi:hypothetical protein
VRDPHKARQTVTTNITTMMDALLVLISLSFHYAYAASNDQRLRFAKRQQGSSSSSLGSTTTPTPTATQDPLPTSIQTRIPIHSSPPPGVIQTAIPQHSDPNPDKGLVIGFSIGVTVLALLLIATGWIVVRRLRQIKQQRAASQNVVPLQPTNHYASSVTKKSFDDTQSGASHK